MTSLAGLDQILNDQIAAALSKAMVAGYVSGVYHDGQQILQAAGSANLRTAAPMTTDTGWLLGSSTKVLVASAGCGWWSADRSI